MSQNTKNIKLVEIPEWYHPDKAILAVDPGLKAGWAVYCDGEYIGSDVCDGNNIRLIDDILNDFDPLVVIIEDQYPGRMRWNAMKTLLRRRFYWSILGEYFGHRVEYVHPKTWQAYFKLTRTKNRTVKQVITRAAQELLDDDKIQDNEADAVFIAEWYLAKPKEVEDG